MAGTVALGLAFVLLLAWDLLSIKRDLDAGRSSLDDLSLDAAGSTGLAGFAQDASSHLTAAADRAHSSLPLRALSVVPFVDDQIAGVRRMADVAADLGRVGAEAAERIDAKLEEAGEPSGRIELLDLALEELDRVEATLDGVDLGPATGLAPPLRDAHDQLSEALIKARDKLDDGREMILPVREMLQGPSTFLLLAANNAEMTGGAGMTLSAGALTFQDGDFQLGDVVPARHFRLESTLDLPEHIRQIYGPTGVGIDLRSTTRSPDLATMGPIAARIMEQWGMEDIDGVIVVDAVALANLMKITGDVELDGNTFTADNVLAAVLHDNYVEFDEQGGPRAERDEYQGQIAKAIFETITEGEVSTIDLAQSLLDSAEGRHLMMWSPDEGLQAVWQEMGLDGPLDENGLMISFQNYSANKMDWYLRPSAKLDVGVLPSGDYRGVLTMTMDVPAIEDLDDASPYILGPSPERQGVFLTVHLPGAAYDIVTPDRGAFRTIGREGPMEVRTFLVDVPMGTTFERTIEFSLPRSQGAMFLLPSARVEPLTLTIDDEFVINDDLPILFSWKAALPPEEGSSSASPWARIPALLGLLATVVATGGTAWKLRREPATTTLPPVATISATVALGFFALAAAIALALSWTGPLQ